MERFQFMLAALGLYYLLTGLWGIVSLESFQLLVWGEQFDLHSRFMMHTASALFTALGVYFILAAYRQSGMALITGALIAGSLFLVNIRYFYHVSKGLLFYDTWLELGFALACGIEALAHRTATRNTLK